MLTNFLFENCIVLLYEESILVRVVIYDRAGGDKPFVERGRYIPKSIVQPRPQFFSIDVGSSRSDAHRDLMPRRYLPTVLGK